MHKTHTRYLFIAFSMVLGKVVSHLQSVLVVFTTAPLYFERLIVEGIERERERVANKSSRM